MLIIALIQALALLLAANVAIVRSKNPAWTIFLIVIVVNVLPVLFISSVAILAQSALYLGMAIACSIWRCPRLFLPLSIVFPLVIYGFAGWLALRGLKEEREQIPFVSLADRLSLSSQRGRMALLPMTTAAEVGKIEEMLAADIAAHTWSHLRRDGLKSLHEDTLATFINQPAFGVARMRIGYTRMLTSNHRDKSTAQPEQRTTAEWSDAPMRIPRASEFTLPNLLQMHRSGIVDFVYQEGFGYFKDHRNVAGFQAHGFSTVPDTGEVWRLLTIDLIGLVVHKKPVAYVSENLPRMDELRGAAKRPLDRFETLGLNSLRGGADLFVRDTPIGRRVFGAIRTVKQCVACHGTERGQLLGAFSYVLGKRGS